MLDAAVYGPGPEREKALEYLARHTEMTYFEARTLFVSVARKVSNVETMGGQPMKVEKKTAIEYAVTLGAADIRRAILEEVRRARLNFPATFEEITIPPEDAQVASLSGLGEIRRRIPIREGEVDDPLQIVVSWSQESKT